MTDRVDLTSRDDAPTPTASGPYTTRLPRTPAPITAVGHEPRPQRGTSVPQPPGHARRTVAPYRSSAKPTTRSSPGCCREEVVPGAVFHSQLHHPGSTGRASPSPRRSRCCAPSGSGSLRAAHWRLPPGVPLCRLVPWSAADPRSGWRELPVHLPCSWRAPGIIAARADRGTGWGASVGGGQVQRGHRGSVEPARLRAAPATITRPVTRSLTPACRMSGSVV